MSYQPNTFRGSWNLVIMTLGDTSTHGTQFFCEKFVTLVCQNWFKHFAILKHFNINSLLSRLYQVKNLWIRLDFLYEGRWQKGYPIHKISLVNLYLEFKASILSPLEGNNKRSKTKIDPVFMYIQYEIQNFG